MKMTPRMLSYLSKRHSQEHERQELLFGILAANIVNFAMVAPKEPTCPADFMPSQFGRKRVEREPTPEEIEQNIRAQFAAFGAPF
jgi:hypothetical protein